ncbi:rhomboid family intramembrane serine protease [Aquisalibacillus elongatus]|uniref:Rhomboid family peptidase n=1 Tax=Aquisalibacillus elongatus TaxID=485577 RepID=A0A3N5BDW5_9BACI|nr:rhomboid family intramembrane serine protease [Aquisalibacillus elongatus]RPF55627.1 rhomboid family peptidase [Aquisalibacillus elongatus]
MYITEQYLLLRTINHFVEKLSYQIVYVSKNRDEYILHKHDRKVSQIIRLKRQTFDWSNHLKQDIEQRISAILRQKSLIKKGKSIQMHFVYVSDLAPVDDFDSLKNTIKVKQSKPTFVNMYYLDQKNRQDEWQRFISNMEDGHDYLLTDIPSVEEQEKQTMYLEQKMSAKLFQKQKEIQQIFSYGKTRLTFLLIFINLVIFSLLELNGGSTNVRNLIDWGAKFNPKIVEGEWWRIISSMFLHIGPFHLFMNMIALYYLGDLTEKIYGTKRFFMIYFLAGIFGSVASFATNDSVSAGASGAIFGLFGALLFFGIHYKDIFFKTMGLNLIIVIGINIVFGLTVPQIDNGAHIGGLIGGLMASQIVHLPNKKARVLQTVALFTFLIVMSMMFLYGLNNA